ncbi:MAG: hypothetical protein ACR2OX_13070 [Methyloligellaceae bacterium]
MSAKKVFLATTTLAVVITFSGLQAAPMVGPGTKVQTEPVVQQAMIKKLKKKLFGKKKKKKYAKAPAKPRYRTCGAYMYRDRRTGKCVDSRGYTDLEKR